MPVCAAFVDQVILGLLHIHVYQRTKYVCAAPTGGFKARVRPRYVRHVLLDITVMWRVHWAV